MMAFLAPYQLIFIIIIIIIFLSFCFSFYFLLLFFCVFFLNDSSLSRYGCQLQMWSETHL